MNFSSINDDFNKFSDKEHLHEYSNSNTTKERIPTSKNITKSLISESNITIENDSKVIHPSNNDIHFENIQNLFELNNTNFHFNDSDFSASNFIREQTLNSDTLNIDNQDKGFKEFDSFKEIEAFKSLINLPDTGIDYRSKVNNSLSPFYITIFIKRSNIQLNKDLNSTLNKHTINLTSNKSSSNTEWEKFKQRLNEQTIIHSVDSKKSSSTQKTNRKNNQNESKPYILEKRFLHSNRLWKETLRQDNKLNENKKYDKIINRSYEYSQQVRIVVSKNLENNQKFILERNINLGEIKLLKALLEYRKYKNNHYELNSYYNDLDDEDYSIKSQEKFDKDYRQKNIIQEDLKHNIGLIHSFISFVKDAIFSENYVSNWINYIQSPQKYIKLDSNQNSLSRISDNINQYFVENDKFSSLNSILLQIHLFPASSFELVFSLQKNYKQNKTSTNSAQNYKYNEIKKFKHPNSKIIPKTNLYLDSNFSQLTDKKKIQFQKQCDFIKQIYHFKEFGYFET